MNEVREMGFIISNSINELSYVTEESNRQLIDQLTTIDSTMKVGNLINTINTYQNYIYQAKSYQEISSENKSNQISADVLNTKQIFKINHID